MSPEVRNEMKYTKKADVWSVGIITIEMIKGLPENLDFNLHCRSLTGDIKV